MKAFLWYTQPILSTGKGDLMAYFGLFPHRAASPVKVSDWNLEIACQKPLPVGVYWFTLENK